MWRKEDGSPQASSEGSALTGNAANSGRLGSSVNSSAPPMGSKVPACVSQGIKIKGEVAGTEDLFIDGTIEGKISLGNSSATVGPNGVVKAEITAREIVFRGVAEGKFTAEERIQVWHTARVNGELKSERISIEDGAELRGKVEAGRTETKASAGEGSGRGKRAEHSKVSETTTKDVATTPGAATAGAD